MSAVLLGWAYRQNTGSAITKAVLVKLVDNANDLGFAHPSIEHLVAFMELSERSVREHIRKLEELGLLTVIRQKVAGSVNLPNRYQLNIGAVSTLGEITVKRPPIAPDADGEAEIHMQDVLAVWQEPQTSTPSSTSPQESKKEPSSTAVAVAELVPPELSQAIGIFNTAAELCPKWTKSRTLTPQRRRVIQARLAEVGIEGWARAVELAALSAHLGGALKTTGSHQGWRMDIAWFSKAENFTKISEGSYAPGRHERPTGLDSIAAGASAFLRERAAQQ